MANDIKVDNKNIYRYLTIDTVHNMLLVSPSLVGLSELVEIHAPDDETPRQACGKILRKLKDPNVFILQSGHDGDTYTMGDRTILRVVGRNRSGMLRRKFTP